MLTKRIIDYQITEEMAQSLINRINTHCTLSMDEILDVIKNADTNPQVLNGKCPFLRKVHWQENLPCDDICTPLFPTKGVAKDNKCPCRRGFSNKAIINVIKYCIAIRDKNA